VRLTYIALAALSASLIACATGSHAAANPSPAAVIGDQSQLTSAEITAANLPTAYDLVDRLRRPWLRRDPMTGGEVAVYQDNQNIGDAGKLRDIPATTISAMQWLSNTDAVRRYGNDVKGSVIVIIIRR
jgi:hypothetical protein